jgi:hypothetical protein
MGAGKHTSHSSQACCITWAWATLEDATAVRVRVTLRVRPPTRGHVCAVVRACVRVCVCGVAAGDWEVRCMHGGGLPVR